MCICSWDLGTSFLKIIRSRDVQIIDNSRVLDYFKLSIIIDKK